MRAYAGTLLLCLTWWTAIVQAQVAAEDGGMAVYLAAIPTCAKTCLFTAVADSRCAPTDKGCMCSDAALQASVADCVSLSCHIRDALFTKNLTEVNCRAPVRDRSKAYDITSITLGSVSGAFVLARLAFNGLSPDMVLGLDDLFILLTLLLGIPNTILNTLGLTRNGLGRDIWTLPFDEIALFGRALYIMEVLYFAHIMLLKMSLLFFYLRIFPRRSTRRLLWAIVVFNVLFGVAFMITAIFQCRPVEFYWLKWDGETQGTCISVNGLAWSNAAISIGLDLGMLAIPLWNIRDLKMSSRKKMGVIAMFAVGTGDTIVSILRLHSLVLFAASTNPTWDQYDAVLWSTVEINLGIICACMPSIRRLLIRFFPRAMGAGSTIRTSPAHYGSAYAPKGSTNLSTIRSTQAPAKDSRYSVNCYAHSLPSTPEGPMPADAEEIALFERWSKSGSS